MLGGAGSPAPPLRLSRPDAAERDALLTALDEDLELVGLWLAGLAAAGEGVGEAHADRLVDRGQFLGGVEALAGGDLLVFLEDLAQADRHGRAFDVAVLGVPVVVGEFEGRLADDP